MTTIGYIIGAVFTILSGITLIGAGASSAPEPQSETFGTSIPTISPLFYSGAGFAQMSSSTAGLRIPGLASLTCIGTDADGDFGAGSCGGGGGGSGTISTSTALVNTQVVYATAASTVGSDAGFTYNAAADRFTIVNASSTAWSSAYASSTALIAGTLNISTSLTMAGDTLDELVGDGLDVSSGDLIFDCSDVAGTGITCSGEDITASLGTSITVGELASADFGDWTCNGSACTIDANSVALTTDTTGSYVETITGTANQISVAGSGAEDADVTLSIPADFRVSSTTLSGNSLFANATSTNFGITGIFGFGGVFGNSWDDFCTSITGGAGLCDGTDATGAGGAAAVATSTNETAGQLPYWTSTSGTPATLGSVATGTLAATSPLTVTAGRSVIGGSATVAITADGIGDTELAFNTGQALTSASTPTFGGLTLTPLTSALLLTNGSGVLAEYAGSSCTNQAVTAISALGVATCTTLNGSYLDLTANYAWTGNQDFGGAAFLEIPNGTGPTANDPGELAHDTTDNQLILDDLVVGKTTERIWGVTVASTSPAFISAGLLPIPNQLDGYTVTRYQCHVTSGTSKVIAVEDASANSSEDITCVTTNTTDDGSITNGTFTASELGYIDFGATTGAVDYVTIEAFGTWTRE